MDNKLIQVVIAITVGIVVLGSLLVPVITDASTTEKTFENDGYYRMTKIASTDEGEYTVEWDVDTPDIVVVNDSEMTLDMTNAPSQLSILIGDDWIGRANITSGHISSITLIPKSGSGITISESLSISFTEGVATPTVDGVEKTPYSYTTAYIPTSDGEYIMKLSNGTAYIHEDSEIVAYGLTFLKHDSSQDQRGIAFSGDTESISPIIWRPDGDTANITFTDVSVNTTEDKDYLDLYSLSTVTFKAVWVDQSTVTTDVTYSYFLVPYEVTAEKSVHLDASEIGLLAVIPVLMIVAFLVFAVRIFGGNRD